MQKTEEEMLIELSELRNYTDFTDEEIDEIMFRTYGEDYLEI